jgi:hypothetical protein
METRRGCMHSLLLVLFVPFFDIIYYVVVCLVFFTLLDSVHSERN